VTFDIWANYTPHKAQVPIHEARKWAKVIVWKAGRRIGKSRGAVGDFLDAYTTVYNMERGRQLIPPFHAWCVVPSLPQSGQAWAELTGLIPSEMVSEVHETEKRIWLRGGKNWQNRPGLIEIKTGANPAALQTVGLDFLWFTEAQDIPNEAFEKALPTTRSPERLGRMIAEGIPATWPDHWFEKLYSSAMRRMNEDPTLGYFALHSTSFENPLLTPTDLADIEGDRDILSEAAWKRLYLAEYDENAAFFKNIDACTAGYLLEGPVPGSVYVAGMDIGRAEDQTVFVIMDREERRVVAHWAWGSETKFKTIVQTVNDICKQWNVVDMKLDASSLGGKMAEEDFSTTSVPYEPIAIVGQNRKDMLERLAGAFDGGTIQIPKELERLLRQLRAMQPMKMTNGQYRIQVPASEHDDEIFALALCLMGCADPAPIEMGAGTFGIKPMRYMGDTAGGGRERYSDMMMRKRNNDRLEARAEAAGIEF
jgi:hypothetical protein